MPVSLLRTDGGLGFAPVRALPFRLGRGADCELVDSSPEVAPLHASLRHEGHAYVLRAETGQYAYVGGRPIRTLALRDGVVFRLARDGARWRFRRRMPGAHPTAADWLGDPAAAAPACGSGALGDGPALGGRDPAHCRRVATDAGPVVVKRLGAVRTDAEAEEHLALLARIGGAPHAALAAVVDGGLEVVDGRALRWVATRWVDGSSAQDVVDDGGMEPEGIVPIVHVLAQGLAHLHARGVVHRDVSPGNVVLGSDGAAAAALIDYGHAVLLAGTARPSAGVVGTPGYVAPEEVVQGREALSCAVDVYGLGAVAYALLVGTPPARGDDLLATLGGALRPPPAPSELGIDLPEALDSVVMDCLSPDPAARPEAAGIPGLLAGLPLPAVASQTRIGDSV